MSKHSPTNIMPFLIVCSQSTQNNDELEQVHHFVLTKNYDIHEMIILAHVHGIIPLLYQTIKKLRKSETTVNLCSLLKTEYDHIVQKNMLMTVELLHIVELFKKHKIDTLAFKGPTLAFSAYGDITLRQFCDLDILIHKKDRHSALTLLEEASYLPQIQLKDDTKDIFLNTVNVLGLYKQPNQLYIEVHWELLAQNYAIGWEETKLWEETDSIVLYQEKITTLVPEQLLLYLCAHASKHLFERLAWICDIDRMVRSHTHLNWGSIQNNAKALGIQRILFLSLYLTQHFYNLPLPTHINTMIQKDKHIPLLATKIIAMHFHENGTRSKNYATFFILLAMREKYRDKLRFTWKGLMCVKFDDFDYVQLPIHLGFLYPIIRIWRLCIKYFKH